MIEEYITTVQTNIFDIDGMYPIVNIQVDSFMFKNGDTVKVTVEKI